MNADDLIGIPFVEGGRTLEGLDCAGLAQEVLRRAGFEPPALPSVWVQDPHAAVERWGSAWECIGKAWRSAERVGDIIVSDPGCLGRSVHLSVVVGSRPQRVLTTVIGQSVHATRPCRADEVVGVYRLKPPPSRVKG